MMWRSHFIYILIIAGLVTCSFTSDVSTDTYVGYAYEEGTQNLIYTEHFTDTFIKGIHVKTQTAYFNPENKLIASRTLDFNHSLFAPDFQTEDLRTGYLEGAVVSNNSVKVFIRESKKSALKEKMIKVPEPFVIDGGFNQFMKASWSDLQYDKVIRFNFVVPCKLDYYELRAHKISSDATTMTIQVEPENMLARWLVAPIIIKYDTNTKRILSYKGKSNISNEKGINFITTLVYPQKGP